MFRHLGQLLLTLALVATLGGHWAILQTVAWTTMLADNLRDSSLAEAVVKTFDGEHPCQLCKQISTGKKSERKTGFPFSFQKFEFTAPTAAGCFTPSQSFRWVGETHDLLRSRVQVPPLPPPRLILPG